MEENKQKAKVEVTDLSISFMFRSVRIFYTFETTDSESAVQKKYKNIALRGEKYFEFIKALSEAKENALKEVLLQEKIK